MFMRHRSLTLCLILCWLMWKHWPHLVKRRAIIVYSLVIVIFHKMSVKLAMTIIDLSAMHPLIVSRMSVRSHFLLLVCFSFLISCQFAGNKKEIGYGEEVQLNVKEVVVPSSDVLNLKSYYLSFVYQSDSLQMLYGYNYKIHGLDCFNLKNMQSSQITFLGDGNSAVVRPVTGLYVQSLDSIWIYDGSQRALLLDRQGQLLNAVNLRDGLTSN